MTTHQSETFNDTNFESEVLNSDQPVLVDFWAEWCGPCRALGPVIETLAETLKGKARVGKLNVEDNPGSAQQYAIESIPAVLIFHQGQVVDRLIGVCSLNTATKKRCSQRRRILSRQDSPSRGALPACGLLHD